VKVRPLIVDDDPSMSATLTQALRKRGFEAVAAQSGAEALEYLGAHDADVVATDLHMAGMSGLELCQRINAMHPDLPVILITAFGNMESAIGAMRAGAYDFVPKPFDLDAMALALERAVRHRQLRQEVRRLRAAVSSAAPTRSLVGASPAMQRLYQLLDRVRSSEASVLITGESGTGKELVARAVHERSPRASGPFVAVDCASIPESLIESELFGYAKGAFTDAKAARPGLFVQAKGGTLFLDEIGELPIAMQPKLLRTLQERRVRAVGSDTEVPIDVRIIAATNRDLEAAIAERVFRDDLYYRLNVIHAELPPLRERGNDVLAIAQHVLEKLQPNERSVAGFSAGAAEKLLAYPWPGNVRELQNCVERALALARYSEITADDLPDKIRGYRAPPPQAGEALLSLAEVERRHVVRVLESARGNKKIAAEILGLDRTTLYRKLERYALQDAVEDQ
jgi:two-component system response regulator HydG